MGGADSELSCSRSSPSAQAGVLAVSLLVVTGLQILDLLSSFEPISKRTYKPLDIHESFEHPAKNPRIVNSLSQRRGTAAAELYCST